MPKGQVERRLPLLIIRDMHIKTTMRYCLTQLRGAINRKSINNKCWRRCGEKGTLIYCWWECKLIQSLGRTAWRFIKNLKMDLRYLSNPSSLTGACLLQQHYLPGRLTCTVGVSWAPSWECQQWEAVTATGLFPGISRVGIWVEHRWQLPFLYGYVGVTQKSDMICCDDPVYHFLSFFKSLTSLYQTLRRVF